MIRRILAVLALLTCVGIAAPTVNANIDTKRTPTKIDLNEFQNVDEVGYPNSDTMAAVTNRFDGYDGGLVQHFTQGAWEYNIRNYNREAGCPWDAGIWFKRDAGSNDAYRAYNKDWQAFLC